MKKFAFFVAVALCLTLCLMIPASAEESAEEPALESAGFRWRLLEDGTAEILKYTGSELQLVIPETLDGHPVTSIGDEAFYNYRYSLEDTVIPASVTHIGSDAFALTDLEKIEIPAGVTLRVDKLWIDGSPVERDDYTRETLPAAVLGDGTLRVGKPGLAVIFY